MDDDATTDSNTIATKAVLTMDGCCAKHRHIRLRGHDAQGNVVQRDSCPECDKELAAARRSLQERQRQLDQQLKALEESGEGSSRGGRNMNGNGNGSGSSNNSGHNRPQYNNSNNNSTSNRGAGIAPDSSPYVPQPPPPTPTWGNPYEHHNYYGGHGGHPPPPGVNTPDGSKSNNNSGGNGMYPPHPYGYPPSHGYPHQSPYGQYPPPPPPQQSQDSESSKFLLTMLRQREEELAALRIRLDTAQQTIQEQSIELATVRSQFEFAQQTKDSEVKIAHLQAQAAAAERFQEESKKLKEAHNQQVMQMQSDFEKTLERLALNASSNHLPSAAGVTPSTDADSTANSITNSVASGPNLNVSANTNTIQPKPKMEQPKKLQEPDGLDESTVGTDALDIYQNDSVSTNQTKNTSTPMPVPSMDKKPAATPTVPAPVNRPWKKDVEQETKAAAAAAPVNPDWDVVEEEEAEDDGDVFTELPNKYKPVTTAQPRAHPPVAKPPSDTFEPRVLGPGDDDDDISHHPGETLDEASLVQTVASSTYGEDRQKVNNQTLLDPYGDQGVYSGMILRSTGMPHGRGQMVYDEDGRIYDGDWRHGRWHGYGRASFSNGDSYEGEYKFDQRHGRGIYKWHDGRVYDGHFNEDKRHGQGVFTWPDGAVYDGAFVNGQREGHGKYTFADGGEYVGNWKDGRYDGFGTCVWEDKRRYEGEWRNGMAHGHGIETYPNGNIRHQGQWVDDEPVR